MLNIPSSRNPFNPFNPLLILPKQSCCCGGKDTSATIFRTQRICVDLCNLWEALLSSMFCEFCAICGRFSSAAGSVNSVQSVGEYTHPNFCGFRGFRGRFLSASNSVRSVDSVGKPTQPNHLCRVKSVGEHEYSHRIRRTHRTFWLRCASHRLHRFSQIRRVWHPCQTHAANSAP